MDFQEQLNEEIAQFGSLEDCPWGTLSGDKLTLGEMTDDHVSNCIQYHQGLAMMAKCTPVLAHILPLAEYVVFKMQQVKKEREK